MKTFITSLLLPLFTMLFSFALNGCYTQLALVDDEQYTPVEQPPIIIYIPVPYPGPDPGPHPHPHPPAPLPPAEPSPTVPEPQSPNTKRDFGSERDRSENSQTSGSVSGTRESGSRGTQATGSDSDTRTSGSTRER
jgi:hypothetical protein